MADWVGVYRRSIAAPAPWWDGDAEKFDSLNHAVRVFTRRQGGKRPVPPPLQVAWDSWGNPRVLPTTLPWLLPEADSTATLQLVALTESTTLGGVTMLVSRRQFVTVRLNRLGHVIVTKPEVPS